MAATDGLAGKVALVTGGSGAIGSACASELASQGAAVAVAYRDNPEAAERVVSDAANAMAVQMDVTEPSTVEEAFSCVESELGSVAVLVTAAGGVRDRPMLRMRDADWEQILRVNLYGAFYCIRRALPGMVADGWGRIGGIGSLSGVLGNPGQTNYAAAKAGLVGLSRALAREVGRQGVTVNVVAPGLVDSNLTEGIAERARAWHEAVASTARP